MQSSYCELSNQTVHYLEGGTGKTVVLVPSLWLDSSAFLLQGQELSKTFHVIIPDIYKGKSRFSDSASSFAQYAKILHEFLQKMKIGNFILVGVSYSGFISTQYALDYPENLEKVLLFSTSALPLRARFGVPLTLLGVIKMLLHNLTSKKGREINKNWIASSNTFFLKHPKQFMNEVTVASNFNSSLSKTPLFKVPVKLFIAKEDEFIKGDIVEKKHLNIKNLEVEVLIRKHAWNFLEEEYFAELVEKNIH